MFKRISYNQNRNKDKNVLSNFPKTRSILSDDYKKIYNIHYMLNRKRKTPVAYLTSIMESWSHFQVAKDLWKDCCLTTLEIGAGTLNHIPYELKHLNKYDIVEPFIDLYKDSEYLTYINNIFNDISDIPLCKKYDRIISIYVFEHILDLPHLVAICGQLLKPDGCLRVAIPNEGTILWKIGWSLTSKKEFKKLYNLEYEVFLKHEHVNSASEIEGVMDHFFKKKRTKTFGMNRFLGFYRFYEYRGVDHNRINDYLKNSSI